MEKINLPYVKKLLSVFLIIGGGFLLVEHIYVWGGFDFYDFPWGHEYYGLAMIVAGVLLALRFKKKEKINEHAGRIGRSYFWFQ